MTSEVKFDEGVIQNDCNDDDAGDGDDEEEERKRAGASFRTNCVAYWGGPETAIEEIDGKTGLLSNKCQSQLSSQNLAKRFADVVGSINFDKEQDTIDHLNIAELKSRFGATYVEKKQLLKRSRHLRMWQAKKNKITNTKAEL